MLRGCISALAVFTAVPALAAEAPNAAHALAQKFAAPTETTLPAATKPAPSKVEKPVSPAKPQAAAMTEPVKPALAKSEANKSEPEKSTSTKSAEAMPTAPVATVPADTVRPPIDYEMEMLRQARAESQARGDKPAVKPAPEAGKLAPDAKPAPEAKAAAQESKPAAPIATPPTVAPAPPPVQAQAQAPFAAPPSPAPANTASPTPPAAAQPSTAAAAPLAATTAVAEANAPAKEAKASDPKPDTTTAKPVAPAPTPPGTPATLLLALETSSGSGKAQASQSFDPVLCLNDTCFVSSGLSADAVKIAKADALKLKTSEEASAESCKGMIACVYRNVSVPADAKLHLIELGSATHESSRATDVKPDKSCKIADGALHCDDPIATPDFKVWVVLEETAKSAGVNALEEAIANGLPHLDNARAGDK